MAQLCDSHCVISTDYHQGEPGDFGERGEIGPPGAEVRSVCTTSGSDG